MPAILIVEDEAKMRRLLELNLGEDGFTTFSAGDAESRPEVAAREHDRSGADRSETSRHEWFGIPAGRQTPKCGAACGRDDRLRHVETAVEAMKAGASDYVLKPFSLSEMRMVIHKELDVRNLREENRSLREALGKKYSHPNVVARSPKMQEVLATVERVAPTNSTVLLGGESGVGKDLIARAIHEKSTPGARAVPQNQQHGHPRKSTGKRTVWL